MAHEQQQLGTDSNGHGASLVSDFSGARVSPCILTRRLEEFTSLTDADRAELTRVCAQSGHTIPARHDLVREGEAPRSVYLIVDGWACHYRILEDGRRQIVDFAIPGDLC